MNHFDKFHAKTGFTGEKVSNDTSNMEHFVSIHILYKKN